MRFGYGFSLNILPSIIAIIFMFVLAAYGFRHRDMPGALPFSVACTFGLLWSLGSIFEFAALDIDLKIFWRKFQLIFQLPSATAITCFLLEYAWPRRWLTRRNLLLLSIPPLLIFLLVITNNAHHWFWEGFFFEHGLESIPGPLMKYFIAYIFINFLMNLFVFGWLFIHSPQNRWPVVIMFSGQIMMRILYFIDIGDHTILDIPYASIGIALSSLMYAIAFFRFQILGPIPLARQAVTKQLPIGMLVLDDQEKVYSLNPAAEEMLGTTNRIAKGMDIRALLPIYPQKDSNENRDEPLEFSLDRKDSKRYYTLDIEILEDWRDLQVGQLLMLTDVTDQRIAQAKILEQGRVLAILQEREQIARELHDNLAQVFAFIDTQGQTIQRLIKKDDIQTADVYLDRLIDAAREGEMGIRESIRGMRLSLSDKGLLSTLENYLLRFEKDTTIRTNLSKSEAFDIDLINPMIEVQLLRIIQEALTNIRKHSKATKVQVVFDSEKESICVTVKDNGRGFEVDGDGRSSSDHFGLKMMQERAEAIGGTIQLSSKPGQGTEILVCVPVDKQKVL